MNEHAATPADVGAILNGRGYDQNGMGGMGWIIGLIALVAIFNGGFGGWGGNRGGNDVVTNADLCNQMGFNNLENAVGRISDNQAAIARQQDNAICNLGYTELQNTMGTRELINSCCCNLRQEIQAEANATRDMIQQDKVERLQAEVAELKMDQRFCGVPRLPLSFTYAVNPYGAFGNNDCGCKSNCSNNVLF